MIKLFKEKTNVDIELKEASLDSIAAELILETKLKNKKNIVDVAIPATFGIPDMVEAGAIEDLTEFSTQYEPKNFQLNRLYSLGDYYKNKFYGYQTDGDTYLMFYNKSFFNDSNLRSQYEKKFGKKMNLPKTWQELDQQIQFFHNPKKGRYGGSLYRNKNYIHWEFWSRLHSKGLFPVNNSFQSRLISSEALNTLEEMIAINKYLETNVHKNGLFDNFKSYAQRDKYCNIGWGGTQKYLNGSDSKMKDNCLFGLLPGGKIKGQTFNMPYFNWGWNYVVSKKSKQKELAYLFSLFASTKEASILSVREQGGFFDPFLPEHYKDERIQNIYGKDFLDVHKKSLNTSLPDFYVHQQGHYFSSLKQGLFAASQGDLKPKRALKIVHDKWERLTDKIGREKQIKQWSYLKNSYPENIKKVLS